MAVIIYHQNNKIVEVDFEGNSILFSQKNIAANLFQIAEVYSNELIIWCRLDLKSNLNPSKFTDIFHHNKIMASYNLSTNTFLPDTIEYVDESVFLNVQKEVSYPTWLMSSDVGGIHSSVLNLLKNKIKEDSSFDYFLHSMAKLTMLCGLLCYSEPLLVKNCSKIVSKNRNSNFLAFRFVKQHYRTRWVFLLFLDLLLYEKRFALFPLLISFGFRKRTLDEHVLEDINVQSKRKVIENKTIDVIIPTIGRKEYLFDILKDLSKQTHLPVNVIVVEQNPDLNSVSELDYLKNEKWPFTINHTFTHKAGACNARNLALSEVKSEWVFMADDDIRIDQNFLSQAFNVLENNGAEQVTFGCYETNYEQTKKEKQKFQWDGFGSGCSVVKFKNSKTISYNESFEHGYGEDSDYGAQLRNLGFDILYSPIPEIIHLKAGIGGFRSKPVLAWAEDLIQPKPSPTVMLYKILNLRKKQLLGYKTVLFIKFYKSQQIKNPIKYLINFRAQWKASMFWAEQLKKI